MLDKEQRSTVMKLFSKGMGVSEIAKKVGVSRQSVYRVVQSDFEEDPEIHALEKQLRKTELRVKIREAGKPLRTRNELAVMKKVVDGLIPMVLNLWYLGPGMTDRLPKCLYCGEELKYVTEKKGEAVYPGYRCNRCKKNFIFP